MTKFSELYNPNGEGESIKGVYLMPKIFFGNPYNQPCEYAAEIINKFEFETKDVYLTRYGCLFAVIPRELCEISKTDRKDALDAIWQFDKEIISIFNKIVCEMVLNGLILTLKLNLITQPSLCTGKKNNNMAILNSGLLDNFPQSRDILTNERWWVNVGHSFKDYDFQTLNLMNYTNKLEEINKFLPLIVSSAIYEYNNGLYSSCLLHSWMCIEIYIDHLWEKHRNSVEEGRKGRLKDNRTYTSSICIEILRTIDIFSQDLAERIHKTRKLRNDLIHASKGVEDFSGAHVGIKCMKDILEILLETKLQFNALGKYVRG